MVSWSHETVWAALDRLAERHGLSVSGLAKKAGLDPTAFNPSKRLGPDDRPRWPSTESIAKVLTATGETLESFMGLERDGWRSPELTPVEPGLRSLPVRSFPRAGTAGFCEDGISPSKPGWSGITIPGFADDGAYALEISGESMLPLYRHGDVIIISPSAPIRHGDRVVIRTTGGDVMVKVLKKRTGRQLVLAPLKAEDPDRHLAARDVEWIARILWASQ
jgi:phage repressor protein C with HTH and peptisase S24 domain